jgi:hypothetical protein
LNPGLLPTGPKIRGALCTPFLNFWPGGIALGKPIPTDSYQHFQRFNHTCFDFLLYCLLQGGTKGLTNLPPRPHTPGGMDRLDNYYRINDYFQFPPSDWNFLLLFPSISPAALVWAFLSFWFYMHSTKKLRYFSSFCFLKLKIFTLFL